MQKKREMYPFLNLDAYIHVHKVVHQKLAIFVNSVYFCHLLRLVITALRIDLPLIKRTTVLKEVCCLLKTELHRRCGFWFWFYFFFLSLVVVYPCHIVGQCRSWSDLSCGKTLLSPSTVVLIARPHIGTRP